MVSAVRRHDIARFVCAAGIVSHYVGDACQPLHGSIYSDGDPDPAAAATHTVQHKTGTSSNVTIKRGQGVHSAYEDAMVDQHATALHDAIPGLVQAAQALPLVPDGHGAATAILQLMDRTARRIPPKSLVDAYVKAGGGKSKRVTDALWASFGPQTEEVMADGAQVLAMLWDSAWAAGGGIPGASGAVDEAALQALYEDPAFVPSLSLDQIGSVLVPPSV